MMVVLAGLPGSGKSWFRESWLRSVPDRASWVVLSTDDLVEAAAMRAGASYDALKREHGKAADREFRRALREALESRLNLLVDRTNLTPRARRGLAARAPEGYRKLCCWFEVPEEVREHRLRSRSGKTIPRGVDAEMRERWVPPSPEEGFDEVIRIKTTSDVASRFRPMHSGRGSDPGGAAA